MPAITHASREQRDLFGLDRFSPSSLHNPGEYNFGRGAVIGATRVCHLHTAVAMQIRGYSPEKQINYPGIPVESGRRPLFANDFIADPTLSGRRHDPLHPGLTAIRREINVSSLRRGISTAARSPYVQDERRERRFCFHCLDDCSREINSSPID